MSDIISSLAEFTTLKAAACRRKRNHSRKAETEKGTGYIGGGRLRLHQGLRKTEELILLKQLNIHGRKAGFTLIELLTAMLCAALVFSMCAGSAYFLNRTTGKAVARGKDLYEVKAIRDYILSRSGPNTAEEFGLKFKTDQEGNLSYEDVIVIAGTRLESIDFYADERIICCELTFPEETYRFAVGTT